MPILARIYNPEAFGVLAIFGAVVSVVSTAITLRYEINIVIPKADGEADQIALLSFVAALILGAIAVMVSYLLPTSIVARLGIGTLNHWFSLACLMAVFAATYSIVLAKLNRAQMYGRQATWRLVQGVMFPSLAIVLGFIGFSDGLVFSQMVATVLVCILAAAHMPILRSSVDIPTLTYLARKYRSAPQLSLPIALLDVFTQQLPLFVMSAWYSSATAGQFNMAWRILMLPTTLVGGAVAQVFFQRFAHAWPDAKKARLQLTRTWSWLAAVGILPMIGLIVCGEWLFIAVLGSAWGDAGRMASILAPMMFASLIHSPTSAAPVVLGIQHRVVFLSILVLIYRPLAIYLGWILDDVYLGLKLYCFFEVAQIVIFQYWVYRKINLHF